jgi:diguanylate cyclase (GGDEF)-like protein
LFCLQKASPYWTYGFAGSNLSEVTCGAEQGCRPQVTNTTSFNRAHNPLRQLPSVLAMKGLRQRLGHVMHEQVTGENELVALLKIDPLTVVRGLRAASPALFRQANGLPTVRGIVHSLGPTLSRKLFLQPTMEVAECDQLKQLWHHAIATAHAAEGLAARTGLLEPEVAYLVGLLHDLPEWLRQLNQIDSGPATTTFQATDCILNWQLPAPFVSLLLAIDTGDKPKSAENPTDPAGLILAAEKLAELAGYNHAQCDAGVSQQSALKTEQPELDLAAELRHKVTKSLQAFGFDREACKSELATPDEDSTSDYTQSNIEQIVVSILGCTRSKSYRGIITLLTAASLRYGNYDRAFYAKWHNESGTLTLRSKADSSARRMVRTRLQVTNNEAEILRSAQESLTPRHLVTGANSTNSLLGLLSTDELLVIPLNCDLKTPAFLLLDRSVTLTPITASSDLTMATMLGMTGSLLIQNLLLRRRRQRADKLALTDPLTRLYNRRMGIHALEQAVARTGRNGRPLTILMCDLDHFKRLNDTLGHVCGDTALRATADVLRHSVRKTDTVCRYGGEEFLIMLPDTTPDEATVLAARMFTSVQARGNELNLPITVSIGLTSHRKGDSMESLLIRADQALYASKGNGRNRFSADIDDDDGMSPCEDQTTESVQLITEQIPADASASQPTAETEPESPEAAFHREDTPAGEDQTDDDLGQPSPCQPRSANPQTTILPKDS